MAQGPASFLGPACSHRPDSRSKNRAAFVETQSEGMVAAACAALWLRFHGDGAHARPVSPQPLPAPWEARDPVMGQDWKGSQGFALPLPGVSALTTSSLPGPWRQ